MAQTYMIVEHFKAGALDAIYSRLSLKGRMMPMGVEYINSWVNTSHDCCFQIVDSVSLEKVEEWIGHWQDLIDFEIIPVVQSEEVSISQKSKGQK